MTYWEKRAAQDMARALRDAQAVIGDVEALHTQARTRITQMMHRIRTRFAKVYGLTQEQAKALLDAPCGRAEYLALLEAIGTLAADNPLRATLLAKAAAPSYAFRESLGTAMQDQLTAMTAHLAGQEAGKLTEHLTQTAVEQSLRAGFRIQQQAGVGFAFGGISEELAREMIKTPWSGASFSSRIWKNQSQLEELLNSVLREGLTTGRSTEAIAGDIADAMGVSLSRARTLVRTETAYISTQADMAAYEEAELEEIQFSAVLDMKTSRICQKMDGKIIKRSEAKVGENIPPMHPNCRSITTCVMREEDKARMTRWARDPVTGEGVKVPAGMTYKEWLALQKETYGEERIEAARKMAVNRKRDKAQFEAYRAVLGKKNLPASLEKFQAMKYTQSEEWERSKSLYRDVKWQKDAQENSEKGEVHTVPFYGTPGSVFDNYSESMLVQRVYYGSTGKPRLYIDLTDHGNPSKHPIVPHAHSGTIDVNGKFNREKIGRELTQAEKIANEQILKRRDR